MAWPMAWQPCGWSLGMLLFVAVNAHAVLACVRAIQHAAAMHRVTCRRKRLRTDNEDQCARTYTHASLSVVARAKRRRLGCCRATFVSSLPHSTISRRVSLTCPWPVHMSFSTVDIASDTETRVAAWLAHPLVAASATKLREVLQSALQDLLVSCLSFILCAITVMLLRRYSTLVVGVSVDLGAFSLEV